MPSDISNLLDSEEKRREEMDLSLADFRAWNEEMARKYNPDDYHNNSFILIRWVESRRVKAIYRLLQAEKMDTVLEVGCGAGNVLGNLDCGRAIGVDLSPDLLQIARTKQYRAPCQLLQSFGEDLPLESGSIDKVVCTEVLEHVQQPRRICAEVNRILKPGGRFVFSVPNESSINAVKALMRRSRFDRVLNFVSGYKFPTDMTEEWHLHSFDADYSRQVIGGYFELEKISYIPSSLFCVRIVVSCRKAA